MSFQSIAKTLVIAVQYGRGDKTVNMAGSIRRNSGSNTVELVVVDNGYYDFPDGRQQLDSLVATGRAIQIMQSRNAGYFGGANLGLAKFQPNRHSWVVISNNDIQFSADFFERLASGSYPANCIVVPRIIGSDGTDQNPQYTAPIPLVKRWAFALLFLLPPRLGWHVFSFLGRAVGQRGIAGRPTQISQPSTVWIPLGAIFLIPTKTMQRLKRMPDESFLYGEEMLLKRDLTAIGGEFIMDPNLIVHHDESSTTSSLGGLASWRLKRTAFFQYWRFYLFGF
jgi:GT2 family glycosyltransferase